MVCSEPVKGAWASVALLVMLGAAPASAAAKTKIVVLEIGVIDTSAPGDSANSVKRLAQIAGEQMSTELGSTGKFQVISSSDFATLLGLERQKALLGCGDDSTNCMAELSGALGAPLVVSGSLSRAGGKMRLDLKLVRTKDATVLSRQGALIEKEADIFTVVPPLVKAIAEAGSAAETSATAAPGVTAPPPARVSKSVPAVIVAGVGLVAGLSGIGLWADQGGATDRLVGELANGSVAVEVASQRRGAIYTERTVSIGLMAGGGAVLAGGLIWFLLSGESSPSASLVPIRGGVAVSWSGAW